MATILIVGAADTGRAPMAAALLRRLLAARGYDWPVASAGVLGHDGADAETEARDAMVGMGLDIAEHRARSLDDTLAEEAALLLAIDGGTARVVRARFPAAARTASLGELAGRPRDIPDPFRMQIGAWIAYAREIDGMLQAALPRIVDMMPAVGTGDREQGTGDRAQSVEHEGISADRGAAAERIGQLLQVAAQMPGVVDWAAARARIEGELAAIAQMPAEPADLVTAYLGLLRAGLQLLPNTPSERQFLALQDAVARLNMPIGQSDLNELSARLATLATP